MRPSKRNKIKRIYNYPWQTFDERDYKYNPTLKAKALPTTGDLIAQMDSIYDQGVLGSCTGQEAARMIYAAQSYQKLPKVRPSRLGLYYNARLLEGTTGYDAGASIRDSIKGANKYGYALETQWPYDIRKFNKPIPTEVAKDALKRKVTKYETVGQVLSSMKSCITEGHCIALGIDVYSSFEEEIPTTTGVIPMPSYNDDYLGGHAIVILGYNDKKKQFKFANSWGTSWGDRGYGYLPYDYVLNPDLAGDFWRILITT